MTTESPTTNEPYVQYSSLENELNSCNKRLIEEKQQIEKNKKLMIDEFDVSAIEEHNESQGEVVFGEDNNNSNTTDQSMEMVNKSKIVKNRETINQTNEGDDFVNMSLNNTMVNILPVQDEEFDCGDPELYLLPKTNIAPSMYGMIERFKNEHVANNTELDNQEWTKVGAKAEEKEAEIAFQDVSSLYIPRNLLTYDNENYEEERTRYVLPLTLQLKTPKFGKYKFRNSRILVAISKALQLCGKDVYLGSTKDDKQTNKIVHPTLVPMQESELKKYMVTPVITSTKVFSTKIFIHCNTDLKGLKTNIEFMRYLGEEGMKLEYNQLDTVVPMNVGILECVVPRADTLLLHHDRLTAMMPMSAPLFQVVLHKTFGKDNKWILMVMIQSDKEDVALLSRILIKLTSDKKIKFFPWHLYSCLTSGKKLTVINKWRKWNSNLLSLIIPGFIDNEDNVPMFIPDGNKPSDGSESSLSKVSVSNYLRTQVKSATGKSLFEYVYPPTRGIREVLVVWENFSNASEFVRMAKGELARAMTRKAINLVFEDPNEAINESKLSAWSPFERASQIIETEYIKPKVKNPYIKRTRYEEETVFRPTTTTTNQPQTMTNGRNYARAVENNIVHGTSTHPTANNNNNNENLNKKFIILQNSVQQMEEKLQNIGKEVQKQTKQELQLISEQMENNNKALKKEITDEIKEEVKNYFDYKSDRMMDFLEKMSNDNKEYMQSTSDKFDTMQNSFENGLEKTTTDLVYMINNKTKINIVGMTSRSRSRARRNEMEVDDEGKENKHDNLYGGTPTVEKQKSSLKI